MKTPSQYAVLDNRPIDQWKVTELKEELKRRKLTIKGLKEDLVKRLDEAIRSETESAKEDVGNGADATPEPVVNTEDVGSAVDQKTKDMIDHGSSENTVCGGMDQAHLDGAPPPVVSTEDAGPTVVSKTTADMIDDIPQPVANTEDEGTKVVFETTTDVIDHGSSKDEVASGMDQAHVYDTAVPLGEGKVQQGEGTDGTDSARYEDLEVRVTSTETRISLHESLASEILMNVQESQTNEFHSVMEDLKSQMEGEVKSTLEVGGLNSFDSNNQVSEVSNVVGFKVKSGSIVNESPSVNKKDELKDDIIDDNVKLELDIRPEMLHPSSSNVLPDDGKRHPMDVEEPNENKVPVEEKDDIMATNAELTQQNDIADVVSSEKLNLDRSSGDDSMEDDALESKQIDSKSNLDEVGVRIEKMEVPLVKEEARIGVMQDDIPPDKKDIHDDSENAPAPSTVKRKLNEQVVGNNEISKRQRRWNSESLKVTEPQSNSASVTTPKDSFISTTSKRIFTLSDSTASEDAPKERVVPPSPKPPTNSLRIDRFLRPFTLKAVQELLGKTGTVTSFWMDHIKTHCYVTYSSVEEAIETRNAVYNLQWPANGGRLLVAEYVDPQEVKMRAEAPPQSPATPVDTGPTTPAAPLPSQPQLISHQQVQRQRLPPPGPVPPLPPPPPLSNPPPARERVQLPPPPPPLEKVEARILTLDDLFRKTKATPRIYYLPLSDEQVAARLKAQGKNMKQ